jgi:hypothetical protein
MVIETPQQKYYRNNMAKCKERAAVYHAANIEKIRVQQKEWNKKHRNKKHVYELSYKHKVPHHVVLEKIRSANGKCEICGGISPNRKRLALDHDHETNQIRGMLCAHCNNGLGMFKDNRKILKKAIKYLEKYKEAK